MKQQQIAICKHEGKITDDNTATSSFVWRWNLHEEGPVDVIF